MLKNYLDKMPTWAFNINDLLEVKAITQAVEKHNVPIIMLISSNAINYSGLEYLYGITKVAKEITGVPVILNTSFNRMGEPIVNTPKEAIECFLGSGLDALAIGDYLVTK